jgi:hypothetical protein
MAKYAIVPVKRFGAADGQATNDPHSLCKIRVNLRGFGACTTESAKKKKKKKKEGNSFIGSQKLAEKHLIG